MQETKLRTAISALVAGTVISLGLIATGSPSFAKDISVWYVRQGATQLHPSPTKPRTVFAC